MNKAAPKKNNQALLPGDSLLSFVEAFCRIFKVGIYYPDGHVVLDQSANACIKELREAAPALSCVKIEVERNGFFVEGTELSEGSAPVRELHLLFAKVGIQTIQIDRSISPKQLLSFVTNVLKCRSQIESTQTLINFQIDDLPDGIRLEFLEFLVDERSIVDEKSENEQKQSLDDLCDALEKQGLNEKQIGECRGLLEKLSESTEDTGDSIKGFSNATWDDVQALLYQIITGTHPSGEQILYTGASSDIDVISSIFESLELGLSDNQSKKTIRFLLSHLASRETGKAKNARESAQPQEKLRKLLNGEKKVSIPELKTFIYGNNVPIKILEQINSVDNSEELSIILQLISTNLEEGLYENLEQKLLVILRNRLRDREKNVLIEGIKNLANLGNIGCFHDLLNKVLHSLRESDDSCSLDFLVEVWNKMPQSQRLMLWSYLVNELLVVGEGENEDIFLEAMRLASEIHPEGMINLSSQLEEMEAFQEKLVAPGIFSPESLFSYKFFSFLLGTSLGDVIAEEVLSGLLAKPQDHLLAAVVPILEISNPSHLVFLKSYLSQAHIKEPPLALKMAAGQVIVEYLMTISKEDKKLPWLQKTIAAMAGFYVKDMESMIHKIIKEKKIGLLPAWPKNCRKAANDVLKKTKKISLKELL